MIKAVKRGAALTRSVARGLWSDGGSLGQKAVRGGIWVMGSTFFRQTIGIIQTIILVRLLLAEDFGIMRSATVMLAATAIFTGIHAGGAIIQKRNVTRATLDTVWIMNICRNGALFMVLYISAGWLGAFYRNPLVTSVLRVLSFRLLIQAFNNPAFTLLAREMRFKRRELFENLCTVVAVGATVALALIWRNVWALVYGSLASALFGVVGSYVVRPYLPSLRFDWHEAKRVLAFGLNLTAVSILAFLATQGDDVLVGRVAGMSWLGLYALAFSLSNLPSKCVTRVFAQVLFPAYAKLQDDIQRLRKAFFRVFDMVVALVVPISVGLFLVAPELVKVVYGNRWEPMVPALRVLVWFGLLAALLSVTGPLLLGVGKPSSIRNARLLELLVLAALIYPFTRWWGIWGTGLATAVAITAGVAYAFIQVAGVLGPGTFTEFARPLLRQALPLLTMTAVVVAFRTLARTDTVLGLLSTATLGAVVYCGLYFVRQRSQVIQWKEILRYAIVARG